MKIKKKVGKWDILYFCKLDVKYNNNKHDEYLYSFVQRQHKILSKCGIKI